MAIRAVEETAAKMERTGEGELTVFHAIVHNDTVVRRLREEHGVHVVEDLDEMADLRRRARDRGETISDTVVFSAHGISPEVRDEAARNGLATLDATCPISKEIDFKKCAVRVRKA